MARLEARIEFRVGGPAWGRCWLVLAALTFGSDKIMVKRNRTLGSKLNQLPQMAEIGGCCLSFRRWKRASCDMSRLFRRFSRAPFHASLEHEEVVHREEC